MEVQYAGVMSKNELIGLLLFLLVCFAIAGLGSMATTPEIAGWYAGLRKPSWTPPNWVFGPVWTILYASMAVSAWIVWRQTGWKGRATELSLFALQLALNVTWSFIFFKYHRLGWGSAEILLLGVAIAATMLRFGKVSSLSALLLAPYLAWVGYAAALNLAIWRMND